MAPILQTAFFLISIKISLNYFPSVPGNNNSGKSTGWDRGMVPIGRKANILIQLMTA